MNNSDRKLLFSIAFLMILATPLMAQRSVGIGTDTPNDNAILHLQSSDQGILVPRLTTSARQSLKDAINVSGNPSDNNGLLIYDLNENKFYYWKNKDWTAIAGSGVAGNQDLTSSKTESEVTIDISDGKGTTFSVEDDDADPANEIQTISSSQEGSQVTLDISEGNSTTFSVDDADADVTNEIQDLSLIGTMVQISGGVGVDLAPVIPPGGTDDQNLILTGDVLSIESGTGSVDLSTYVDDADADPTNEHNTDFQVTGSNLEITDGGGTLTVPLTDLDDGDNDPTNENQTVSAGADISVNQVGQDFEVVNTAPDQTVTLADGGSGNTTVGGTYPNLTIDVPSLDDADADPSNELQNLDDVLTAGNDAAGSDIINLAEPTNPQDAATKNYVDTQVGGLISLPDGQIFIGDAGSNPLPQTLSQDVTIDNTGVATIQSIQGNTVVAPSPADGEALTWNAGQWEPIADGDSNPNNEVITTMILTGMNILEIVESGAPETVDLSSLIDDADADPTNEYNTGVVLNGTDLETTDGGGTIITDLSSLGDDADADPTNEYNTGVVLNGTDLETTDGGGTIVTDLSSLGDDADADPTNEYNTGVVLNGTDLETTDAGGTIVTDLSSLGDDADADPTNEYNTGVVLNGTDLETTDGGGTIVTDLSSLGDDADADPTNEIELPGQAGQGGFFLTTDGSTTSWQSVLGTNPAATTAFKGVATGATQSIGVGTQIQFNEQYDLGGNFDDGNDQYIVPSTGTYHFDALITFPNVSNNGIVAVEIEVDGSNVYRVERTSPTAATVVVVVISMDIQLTAGQIVTMVGYGSPFDVSSDIPELQFSGRRIL